MNRHNGQGELFPSILNVNGSVFHNQELSFNDFYVPLSSLETKNNISKTIIETLGENPSLQDCAEKMIDTYIWNQRGTTKKLLSQITTDDKYRSIFKEDIEALLDIRRNMSSNGFIANKVIYQQFILIIKKHAIAIFNAKLLKNKTLEKERSALSKTQKNPTTP